MTSSDPVRFNPRFFIVNGRWKVSIITVGGDTILSKSEKKYKSHPSFLKLLSLKYITLLKTRVNLDTKAQRETTATMTSRRGPPREIYPPDKKKERLMSDVVRGGLRSWGSEHFPAVAQENPPAFPPPCRVNSSSSRYPVNPSYSFTPRRNSPVHSFLLPCMTQGVVHLPPIVINAPSLPATSSALSQKTWAQTAALPVNASTRIPPKYRSDLPGK